MGPPGRAMAMAEATLSLAGAGPRAGAAAAEGALAPLCKRCRAPLVAEELCF